MKPASGKAASLVQAGTIFVLGKGGVGKSVVSAGLAALSARAGRRTLLVRIGEGLDESVPRVPAPTPSKHGFDEVDLEPRVAMDDFVHDVVPLRPLAERITQSEVYRRFFAAAPGLPELVLLGRIRRYALETGPEGPRFQSIVVDCPSTGHGLLMLETPFAAFRAVSIGPFARLAAQIMDWLKTGVRIALVAIPEEMAVVEAIEFKEDLAARTGLVPALAILNRARQEGLSARARLALTDVEAAPGSNDRLLLDCAAQVQRRMRLEAFHRRRLVKGLGLPPIVIGELANFRPATVAVALGRDHEGPE